MKKIIYIIIVIYLFVGSATAQQLPLSSLYNVNKFQVNSAYAGFNKCLEGYLSHRSQWVGINGAPTTEFLSIHSGIGKNFGIGANVVYDQTNIISKFSGSLALAYRVKLGVDHNLRLGFSGGIFQINTTPSNAIVDDVSDNIIVSGDQSSMAFSNDFSIYYNYRKLEIGVSVPQIIETNASFDLASSDGGFEFRRHIISTIGYDFNVSEKISIQPSILHKSLNGTQNQVDINGQVTFNRLIFVGLGYRTNAGVLARLGMNLKNKFTVAYAYDFAGGNLKGASDGSHEIMLGVKFCRNKKEKIVEVVTDAVPEPIAEKNENEEVVLDTVPEHRLEKVVAEEKAVEALQEKETSLLLEETILEKEEKEKVKKAFETKIYYLKNSNIIDNKYKNNLNEIAKEMVRHPEKNIDIVGHSCDLGGDQVREDIGRKRAESVRDYLISKNVRPDQISIKWMSDSKPMVPNTSETNREKNRRVEFVLIE